MCDERLHKNCVPTDATLAISKNFSSLLKNLHSICKGCNVTALNQKMISNITNMIKIAKWYFLIRTCLDITLYGDNNFVQHTNYLS